MAKGIFTQSMCLLTNGQAKMEDIRLALQAGGFEIIKEVMSKQNACFGGPTLVIPFLPEVNGYVAVDVVSESWPDTMGDPKLDPMTFGAWSTGHFGPLAYPGGLKRAGEHAWAWQEGRSVPKSHRGFIRIRLSYTFGAKADDPIFPEGYDPCGELRFLSRVASVLFDVPGVICYFNPNGEVLRGHLSFKEILDTCTKEGNIPLPLWANVRFFRFNDKFSFMDTVGNAQLDLRDIEVVFPSDGYAPGDIDYYLRNVTHYLLEMGRDIRTWEAIDGPGESNLSWTVEALDEGTLEPPRAVLRLYPKANGKEVQELIASTKHQSGQA